MKTSMSEVKAGKHHILKLQPSIDPKSIHDPSKRANNNNQRMDK